MLVLGRRCWRHLAVWPVETRDRERFADTSGSIAYIAQQPIAVSVRIVNQATQTHDSPPDIVVDRPPGTARLDRDLAS